MTMTLLVSTVSCSTAPDIGLQKIEAGHPAPGDGAFADKATIKGLNKIVKENHLYEKELANQPSAWSRWWTNMAVFTVGIGIGVLIP